DAAPPFDGPCVVKPNSGGSSVGVTLLSGDYDAAQWKSALQNALADGSGALVEEMIVGTEVTASVLGVGNDARALPIVEVVPQIGDGFFDFQAKYSAGGAQHLIPPRLAEDVQEQIRDYVLRAFGALGCRGVARADFIISSEGTPYFLEINTLPGMTNTSLVPEAAAAAGISFNELVEMLVADALQ
ncbi:MAG TPA: ATP-grasp domain-containing protein, partial [Abditibacteriaceae bacterium]